MSNPAPCGACGAPIDCPSENDYIYTLTGDPTLPYTVFCPAAVCLPVDSPQPIFLDCCGHQITRYVYPTTTAQQLSDIVQGMLQECENNYAAECSNPPPPDQIINPSTFYFNSPQTCTVPC